MPDFVTRAVPADAAERLAREGLPDVLARVFAARGVASGASLRTELAALHPPALLRNADEMARLLADAIAAKKRLVIVADYDVDGATACAVGLRAMKAMGATVDYLVPNRFEYGYGLTPEIARLARETKQPDLLITVDNGIASVEGVAEANRLGMPVLVTDHHLPGDTLPEAACIVNPNQPGCRFPSRHLAGVGVMFYVMMALRAELRTRGHFGTGSGPNLAALLDLVALGTVADVVPLDENNRILVHQGLARIRQGLAQPGVLALLAASRRDPARASTYDLGFMLGPRLNAAGRLDDMSVGIDCLTTGDAARAASIAAKLDGMNRERREIEADMRDAAFAAIERVSAADGYSVSLYEPDWHQGVIGIVASRIKDRYHRPVFAFARSGEGEIKGSGRSIPGLHLRDALDLVFKRRPGLIRRFGGHAAAAGLTLAEGDFPAFAEAFEQVASELLTPADLAQRVDTDGSLPAADASLALARAIERGVWGQGFPEPRFQDAFEVASQRIVGEKHTRLRLARDGRQFGAILFNHATPLPRAISAVYRLGTDEYGAAPSVSLTIEHWQPAG